jgi:conjugative transfer signal peptidase TraF
MLGLGLVGLPLLVRPAPRLVYNASASAPIGLYLVRPISTITRGDLLLIETPKEVRDLAAERGYLPLSVPMVKRVAALPGDHVCAIGHTVYIDGRPSAQQLAADRQGRPLPLWSGCRLLNAGEIFLLMADVPDSFDSRYFGPVQRSAAVGRLVPLWLQ